MKTVTIRDVAKQAGVGLGTVSRVINDSPLVNQATRLRVQEVISELHFVPNPTELIVRDTTAPPAS
jgi:DNA-binding LacI/PurR family transcriptional regulator